LHKLRECIHLRLGPKALTPPWIRPGSVRRQVPNFDQEIIMEKDKTYVKNILDPEFSEDDHSRLYSKKPKSFRMTMRKT
jgi:hypothetical protein